MINTICKIINFIRNFDLIISKLNETKISNGKILSELKKKNNYENINDYEFKIFSQFGEDGIIQYLINNLNITKKKFIEFGVENYEEANTRFLLENDNWSGLIIDSSKKNINYIKKQNYYWRHDIKAVCEFLGPNNINKIIEENHFNGNIGLLSIDIDGNDYWLLKAIDSISPDIIIMEYNANFGSEKSLSIKFDEKFQRGTSGINKLIYGCSLKAASKLCEQKGYSLVCTNKNGNNAFFVKKILLNEKIKEISCDKAFHKNSFKEYKDNSGAPKKITEKKVMEIQKSDLVIEV